MILHRLENKKYHAEDQENRTRHELNLGVSGSARNQAIKGTTFSPGIDFALRLIIVVTICPLWSAATLQARVSETDPWSECRIWALNQHSMTRAVVDQLSRRRDQKITDEHAWLRLLPHLIAV